MNVIPRSDVFKRIGVFILGVIVVLYVKDSIEHRIDAYLRPDHITAKSMSTQQLRLVDANGITRGSMSCRDNDKVSMLLSSANGDSRMMMGVGDDNLIYFRLLQDVTTDAGSNSMKGIELTIAPDQRMWINATSGSSAPFQDSVRTSIDLLRNE
jgi:hypothetical protein